MREGRNAGWIALTELVMQCVLFVSVGYTCYFGILRMDSSHFFDGVWIVAAVTIAFAARKLIRRFMLFMISNAFILAISYMAGTDETQITLNVLIAFILCVYSTGLKNREVQTYKDNSIPIRDGQNAEMVRNAAMRSLVAKEAVNIYFIAVIVVGYFMGASVDSRLLMNIQGLLCIIFIVTQILHNNMKSIKQECDLNGAKINFPREQMILVSRFVTVISVLLISLVMLAFYNGYYGNVFGYITAGFKGIIRLILKAVLFIMGLSGFGSDDVGSQQTEISTEEALESGLEMTDNDFMELMAEIFGMVLIAALIIGVIYLIKVYAASFNRVKKVGTDTVEHIKPSESTSHVKPVDIMSMKNESKETKSIRKMFKKSVLGGFKGKHPDGTYAPGKLTRAAITENESDAATITKIYEKARYSDQSITDDERAKFKEAIAGRVHS